MGRNWNTPWEHVGRAKGAFGWQQKEYWYILDEPWWNMGVAIQQHLLFLVDDSKKRVEDVVLLQLWKTTRLFTSIVCNFHFFCKTWLSVF